VPQPAAAPTPTPPAPAPAQTSAQREQDADLLELISTASTAGGRYELGSVQIRRAIELEANLVEARKARNDNRDLLRLLARNESLNEDQIDFVEIWAAQKTRGGSRSQESQQQTKRLKELATGGEVDEDED